MIYYTLANATMRRSGGMVDAHASGACELTLVEVQLLSSALDTPSARVARES